MRLRTWGGGVLAVVVMAAAPAYAKDAQPNGSSAEPQQASMSPDAMFELLVAEVAAQRGDVEPALAIYHRMSRELRDVQLARRAVEMAVRARAFGAAIESAALLLELEPNSALGREIMAALLANEASLDKATATIGGLLQKNP